MVLLLALALPVVVVAQQSADPRESVARLEQQRLEAIRSGGDIVRFYAPEYRGINALGQYETREQILALKADATYARVREVTIEVHDETAIVTGVEGASGSDRERVLRIWTRSNGVWTIAAAQSTWIGDREDAPPPSGRLTTPGTPFVSPTRAEESLWLSQDALMHAFADANPDAYKIFSTETSLRMTTNGDAIPREQWLETIARRQKGPVAGVDEVRMSFFGDVAVVNLRGHEMNPTRQSWVYVRQRGLWLLHLRFTTLIRI
ncbi:MAG TPA: nuclear transport factor 2 family protein [Vicinamibacterales bacterium]|nr:nuclear transport factor 2 family protein [Vicinamibacterales bacterium]